MLVKESRRQNLPQRPFILQIAYELPEPNSISAIRSKALSQVSLKKHHPDSLSVIFTLITPRTYISFEPSVSYFPWFYYNTAYIYFLSIFS